MLSRLSIVLSFVICAQSQSFSSSYTPRSTSITIPSSSIFTTSFTRSTLPPTPTFPSFAPFPPPQAGIPPLPTSDFPPLSTSSSSFSSFAFPPLSSPGFQPKTIPASTSSPALLDRSVSLPQNTFSAAQNMFSTPITSNTLSTPSTSNTFNTPSSVTPQNAALPWAPAQNFQNSNVVSSLPAKQNVAVQSANHAQQHPSPQKKTQTAPPTPKSPPAPGKGKAKGKFAAQFSAQTQKEKLAAEPPIEVGADEKKKKDEEPLSLGSTGYLFDPAILRTINIIIDPVSLASIDANPTAENWVPCTVEIDHGTLYATRYTGAGCRYKGSVGSLRMCVDRLTGLANEQCRKLSWKLDADKYLPPEAVPQRFPGGQKQLAVGGLPVDLSLLTERLAAGLMEKIGMPAARDTHVRLFVNGLDDGLYSLMEVPDDIFTRARWSRDLNSGSGAMYKDALFRTTSTKNYFKTVRVSGKNEDNFMEEVSQAIVAARDDFQRQAILEKYFDAQSFIDITAFNTILGNTDDWRQRHNFFWYVLETSKKEPQPVTAEAKKNVKKTDKQRKLVMIPWDYDRLNDENAKTRGQGEGAPTNWYAPVVPSQCTKTTESPEVQALSHDRREYNFWLGVYEELPPDIGKPINCDESAKMFALLAKKVNERIVELANRELSDFNVKALMDQYSRQIDPYVEQNSVDPPNRAEWMQGKADLERWLRESRSQALTDAQAAPGSPITTPAISFNAFPSFSPPASSSIANSIPMQSFVPFVPQAGTTGMFQPKGR